MDNYRFTKGKWVVRKNGLETLKVLGAKTKKVCEINCNLNNKIDEVNIANALLISKAPEMLEMLNKLCKLSPTHSLQIAELMDKAEVLIKEATEL